MPTIKVFQNNFTTGEISPQVLARTDLAKYEGACKTIKNAIVMAQGGVTKRPGTKFVSEEADGILIPFTYSLAQTYAILFMDRRVRFFSGGGLVIDANGNPYEVESPYSAEDLPLLKFTQSADILYLVHPKYPPTKLCRYDHTNWRFEEIVFWPNIQPPTSLNIWTNGLFVDRSGTSVNFDVYYCVSSVSADGEESLPGPIAKVTIISPWPQNARVYLGWNKVNGAVRYEIYKNTHGWFEWAASTEYTEWMDDYVEPDGSRTPKEFRDPFHAPETPASAWVVGGVPDQNATLYVRVSAVNSGGAESVATAEFITHTVGGETVQFTNVGGAEMYYVYAKRGENEPWVYTIVSPRNDTTTYVELDGKTYLPGVPLDKQDCYPGAVGIYQQRLMFGRTDRRPQTIWMSETGSFNSMAVSQPMRDDSAITVSVDSRQMNEVRHFVAMTDAFVLTNATEFRMTDKDGVMTPGSVGFRPQSYWGSSHIPPIVIGTTILMVDGSGRKVRDIHYNLQEDGYSGDDRTILAEHLLPCPIKDWAYQQNPYSTVYIVREDGVLLTFTYLREQEVWAWAQHDSDGCEYRSVCSVHEGSKDLVYFLVKRTRPNTEDPEHPIESYFVEEQVIREFGTPSEDSWFVDSGLELDEETEVTEVSGLQHLAGKDVYGVADGSFLGVRRVSHDGKVTLNHGAKHVIIGLPYDMEIKTADPNINGQDGTTFGQKKTVGPVTMEVLETAGIEAGADENHIESFKVPNIEAWGEPIKLFSGKLRSPVPGFARDEAGIVIRSRDPFPATVLAVRTEVRAG